MTAGASERTFDAQEVAISLGVALLAQLVFVAVFQLPPPKLVQADISNDNAKPIAVSITPLLKLGTKDPKNIPSQWQRRRAVAPPKTEPTALPSPQAEKNPATLPTARPDAGYSLYLPDAAPPTPGPETPASVDAGNVATASSVQGSEQGAANGTETDPLKARAADMYRAQLASWFVSRFNIRGKIPFDKLKALHALAVVTITDRHVVGFSVSKPSGDPTFDGEVQSTLSSIQSGGAELPAPPPMYPDMLGASLPVNFQCSIQKYCE